MRSWHRGHASSYPKEIRTGCDWFWSLMESSGLLDEPARAQTAKQLGNDSNSTSTSSSSASSSDDGHASGDNGEMTVFCMYKMSKSVCFGGTEWAIAYIFPIYITHKDFVYPLVHLNWGSWRSQCYHIWSRQPSRVVQWCCIQCKCASFRWGTKGIV